jgi:hypothetical protein
MSNRPFSAFWLNMVLYLIAITAKAQPYVQIPYNIGIQTVGGVNITTTGSGFGSGALSGPCSDYYLYYTGSSFNYSFAVPVKSVKYRGIVLDSNQIGFDVNNSFYPLSSSNITGPISCYVNTTQAVANSSGFLTTLSIIPLRHSSGDIVLPGLTQLRIYDVYVTIVAGTQYSLYFQSLDTLMTIVQPFKDTLLCAGDSLKLAFQVTRRFRSNNTFTVQLSDSSGSFPMNPTVIGSKQTDTTDTITCYIPLSTITAGKYKIRMISSYPNLISGDNIVNIGIGNHIPPKPIVTSNSPLCIGDSIRLGATDTGIITSYSWTGPLNFKSAVQNPILKSTTLSNAGQYIVTVWTYGCKTKDTTNVVILSAPVKPTVTSNSPICPGDTMKLTSSSSSSVSYNWTGPNNFVSTNQNPIVLNASTNLAGNYTVTVSWTTNTCVSKDSISVTIKPLPAKPVINSNAPICIGDSLQLSSSTTTSGVSYKWAGPNGFSSNAKDTGIGNTVSACSGDYVVVISLNGCIAKDTESVLIKPFPQNVTASSNTPVCPGTTLHLTGSSSSPGTTWSWTGPGNYSDTSQNAVRNNMATAWAGTYTVSATLNGCSVSANTSVASYITTPIPIVSTNSPVCYGGTLNLFASSIPGAVYIWYGPNNYHSNVQNATRPNMGAADAGVYTVNANINGCISQTAITQAVTLITGPSVSAYASPSSTICAGTSVALVAVPTNIGSSPATYNWYKNGNNTGGTGSSYIVPAPTSGDVFYVMMSAGTACNTPISSNNITVTTLPTTPPPSVTITASPGTDIWPYLNVNFSISSLTNGGSAPTYQWKLNGQNVSGAISNKWNTTTLKDGDSVCLLVTSSDQCATPKSTLSNCLRMKVPTGVGPLNPLRGDLQVYPNPTTSSLVIEGAGIGSMIQVNNIIGQTVYQGVIISAKETINTSQWAAGAYLLHLTDKDGMRIVRKVVKE